MTKPAQTKAALKKRFQAAKKGWKTRRANERTRVAEKELETQRIQNGHAVIDIMRSSFPANDFSAGKNLVWGLTYILATQDLLPDRRATLMNKFKNLVCVVCDMPVIEHFYDAYYNAAVHWKGKCAIGKKHCHHTLGKKLCYCHRQMGENRKLHVVKTVS